MLRVSEMFYSIQGEGRYAGHPAVFLRLSGCNLMCGGPGTEKDKQLHNGATWRCDTVEQWMQGVNYTEDGLVEAFHNQGFDVQLRKPNTRLIITGGEPLLWQKQLALFVEIMATNLHVNPSIDIETNGTIQPIESFDMFVDQYVCSPKLSNSGMDRKQRYNIKVLKWFATTGADFKFVVTGKEDLDEIESMFVQELALDPLQIFLMPGGEKRKELIARGKFVIEYCKRTGYKFSSRMHIIYYNKKVGV